MSMASTYRRIGIVGTGRVAGALALALAGHSSMPVLVWGRAEPRVQALVARIGHAQAAADLGSLARDCDMIVLAVADDALSAVIDQIAGENLSHAPFVLHVSGKNGVAILAPLAATGALVAAIHPAMTFTGEPEAEIRRMAGAGFAMTAQVGQAVAQAERWVGLLGGVAINVPEQRRVLYHAALCHAANHLVTLLAGAREALGVAGVEAPEVVLGPLVRAAAENSLSGGMAALSGPLLRGDKGTIANHLAALASECSPVLPAYQGMAAATLAQLEREGHEVAPDLLALLATR